MYHYELHREIAAERFRQAEHERLVRRVRKAARRSKAEKLEGPVIASPVADRYGTAA